MNYQDCDDELKAIIDERRARNRSREIAAIIFVAAMFVFVIEKLFL